MLYQSLFCSEECFKFTDNFIRIILPISAHDTAHDTAHDVDSISKAIKTIVACIEG